MNFEIAKEQAEWLQTLDYTCKVNTLNYWGLRDLVRYKRIEGLPIKMLAFIRASGWTDLGVFSVSISKRRVVHFQSFQDWLSADYSEGGLSIAPMQLIELITNAVQYDHALESAIAVVTSLEDQVLKASQERITDISAGLSCLYGDTWVKLEHALSERLENPVLSLETTIVGENVFKSRSGSTQRVLDRIQRVLNDDEQIVARGLSRAALTEAYTLLIQGMATPTQALRIAGLITSSSRPSRSVYLVKDIDESAKRIVQSVGSDRAHKIAELILKYSA